MYRNRMGRNQRPMCTWDDSEFSDDDRRQTETKSYEREGSEDIRVTYYPDGSSRRHCGGPCGDITCNEFGEEC